MSILRQFRTETPEFRALHPWNNLLYWWQTTKQSAVYTQHLYQGWHKNTYHHSPSRQRSYQESRWLCDIGRTKTGRHHELRKSNEDQSLWNRHEQGTRLPDQSSQSHPFEFRHRHFGTWPVSTTDHQTNISGC